MVIKQIQTVSLWDTTAIPTLLVGVRIAEGSAEYDEFASQSMSTITPTNEHCGIGLPIYQPSTATESQCSHCQITFSDRKEQVSHYRLDWHRCNLQRSLTGKPPLTEEQFLQEMSDVSSLSGSDEEEEEEEEDVSTTVLRKQARMFFCNVDGNVISIFRSVLFGKREEMCGEQDVLHRLQAAPRKMNVGVILLGGGHFAAAVFKGNEVVIHKTFHNYTVRAKQGGSQSSKDGQSGTSHPKSSGASLRRYNELSQQQHIQELMESWKLHLSRCNLIFYRAKNQDRKTLFSGKNRVLSAQDDRLRTIPFPTKRAKFSEVKRVYELLSSIVVHGTEEEFRTMVQESRIGEVKPAVKKKEPSPKKEKKKTKSERREIPKAVQSSSESDIDESESMVLEMSNMTFGMQDIGGGRDCSFDSKTLKKLERQERRNHPKKDVVKAKNQEIVWNEIYTACRTGKKDRLLVALKVSSPSDQQGYSHGKALINALEHTQIPSDFSNIIFGKKERTMLHIAAESGHRDLIWWLLENGCDPGAVDDKGTLPINVSKDKDTRNMFRRFMSDYPDKYDYKEAGIYGPLTAEEEAKEKEKDLKKKKAQIRRKEAQEREKREKEEVARKEKKEREEEARREREEKQRFLKLSDREKRALAAERRFLQVQSSSEEPKITKQRCFMCGADITGMVPFEYNDYRFCTTKCVRDHRTKKP